MRNEAMQDTKGPQRSLKGDKTETKLNFALLHLDYNCDILTEA